MTFDVTADAYALFMGRFSSPLAVQFAALTGARQGQRALDVGCGPGALTAELVARLGAGSVSAVDPSTSFVDAARARFPDVDVRAAAAEDLPYGDDSFDLACAQLVVHFMSDPVAGLAEMRRVTRPGGQVAASVWDHGGAGGPLSTFWRAVHEVDPDAPGESGLAGSREGHLGELCAAAGLRDVVSGSLTVRVPFATFADWWDPFLLGVGPAGAYLSGAGEAVRERVREGCARLLPPSPFEVAATAWTVLARA